MTQQSPQQAEKLRQWVQIVRKNPDPMQRLGALLETQKYSDSRLPTLYAWVSENDKHPQVRNLAHNLLTKGDE